MPKLYRDKLTDNINDNFGSYCTNTYGDIIIFLIASKLLVCSLVHLNLLLSLVRLNNGSDNVAIYGQNAELYLIIPITSKPLHSLVVCNL